MNKTISVLVIEDDPVWSVYIESIIEDSHYLSLGSANTIPKAQAMIDGLHPSIIICDVKVENITTIHLLQEPQYSDIPVIFMTGHLEESLYNIILQRPKSTYLAKPFHKLTLHATLELMLSKYPVNLNKTDQSLKIRGRQQHNQRIYFKDIVYIEADGNYSIFSLLGSKKYAQKKALKVIINELDDRFIRIHKTFIINKNYVKKYDLRTNTILIGDQRLPVGRSYKENLNSLVLEY